MVTFRRPLGALKNVSSCSKTAPGIWKRAAVVHILKNTACVHAHWVKPRSSCMVVIFTWGVTHIKTRLHIIWKRFMKTEQPSCNCTCSYMHYLTIPSLLLSCLATCRATSRFSRRALISTLLGMLAIHCIVGPKVREVTKSAHAQTRKQQLPNPNEHYSAKPSARVG